MIGFLKPYLPSLKKEEKEIYNIYFCSLCIALTKKYGIIGPLINNYEGVFALILLSALSEEKEEVIEARCPAIPFSRRKIYRVDRNLNLIISMLIIILVEKLKDDIKDERSFTAYILCHLLNKHYLKSRDTLKELNFPIEKLDIRKKQQDMVEQHSFISINSSSSPFASSIADVFNYMASDKLPSDKRDKLEKTGYQLGKFIYLYDAYKDFSGDLNKKRFNALSAGYPQLGKAKKLTGSVKSDIKKYLTFCAVEIRAKLDELPFGNRRRLLENILFDSIVKRIEKI
jgi:hypothetical protein